MTRKEADMIMVGEKKTSWNHSRCCPSKKLDASIAFPSPVMKGSMEQNCVGATQTCGHGTNIEL